MKQWRLEYLEEFSGNSPIEQWLDSLTVEQLKGVAKKLKLLALCGNTLKLPHSYPLGKGLFELRERRYGYRMYYGFYGELSIIIVAAGDKSTQKNDIKIARERLAQFKKKKV